LNVTRTWAVCAAVCLAVAAGCSEKATDAPPEAKPEVFRIVVMDPLAAPLACECVEGYAQRRYDLLAGFLEKQLDRPVQVVFGESLAEVIKRGYPEVHLIIGKKSVVEFDAREIDMPVHPVAMLTGKDGRTDFTGLFVVRSADAAKRVTDLKGYRIQFGPLESEEKHDAAFRTLQQLGVPAPEKIDISPGCADAALKVVENDADVGVISSYAYALLEGCDAIDKGDLRVVGKTGAVPFITVFAAKDLRAEDESPVVRALLAAAGDADLLVKMESERGFVPAGAWTDWMGPRRDGESFDVPRSLPKELKVLWKRDLTGNALAGVAATR